MIRAFVGITVPDPIADTLETAQIGLDFGRVVPPENFHLTLAFLGDHPDPVIEDMHHGLEMVSAQGMTLALDGLGVFGGGAPRVLFAEVQPDPGLSYLRRKVRAAARDAQIDLEHKRFHPHITLARFGKGLWPDQTSALQTLIERRMALVRGAFQVTKFALYESRLLSHGPVYEVLAEYELNAPIPASETIPGR